jgi:lipopolysaccharide/colanic/teichoic acid biosynthesis glycosyltransferase
MALGQDGDSIASTAASLAMWCLLYFRSAQQLIALKNAGRGSLRTECLGQKIYLDSSILLPHLAYGSADARKEGAQPCLGGDWRAEMQRADSVLPGFRLFFLSDGHQVFDPFWRGLSQWTRSAAKRVFDCVCVLLALPVVLPLFLAIGAAVRLTSRGPILFLQERAGMKGRNFTIFKFRTMVHVSGKAHHPVTTLDNQRFTSIGPLLRRLKFDELPQLANVLLGHMSLVGPRPKIPEHLLCELPCRPGVTSTATIAFAEEAAILAGIPRERLDDFYRDVVLPAKRQMDAEYLAQATFFSDLGLLIKTALRRWNRTAAETFIAAAAFEFVSQNLPSRMTAPSVPVVRMPMPIPAMASHMAAAEQATAV